jgi:dehydrogenase/reductase SDR family protein 12
MGGRMSYCATAQWWMEGTSQYTKSGFIKNKEMFHPLPLDLTGQSFGITGANSGLGYAVTKELAKRNAEVHMICRNRERGERAQAQIVSETSGESSSQSKSNVHLHIVDVSDISDVKRFASEFIASEKRMSTLINNAGVVPETRIVTQDGHEVSFATMAGGTFLLTSLLLPVLGKEKKSRVVNVSSAGMYTTKLDVSNIQCDADDKYDGVFAYAHAKRAQVILTEMFQERFGRQHLTAATGTTTTPTTTTTFHSCHPGWSDTPGVRGASMEWFNKKMEGNLRSPEEGADTVVWLACSDETMIDEHPGKFWFDRNVVRQHMTMAWTKETLKDRNKLWEQMCVMYDHVPLL